MMKGLKTKSYSRNGDYESGDERMHSGMITAFKYLNGCLVEGHLTCLVWPWGDRTRTMSGSLR